ncbi:MAG: thioredoxin-disulfide reductase [candidate division WOR-3 bacterium]
MFEPEILIIGAGPAGLTAAIYSSRNGHPTLILEKEVPGGQMAKTAFIENYPGFSQPVKGFDLIQEMETQARRFGAIIEQGEATALKVTSKGIELQTTIRTYTSKAVIIATGTQPRSLGLENETQFIGKGISYCAICDGPLFKDKEVAVVGGGDSALEEAEFLTRFCSRVHLIHRRDEFRAARVVQERVRANPKITLHLSQVIAKIIGKQNLESLELRDLKTGNSTILPVSGLFVYIGLVPNTGWCQGVIALDEQGFVITDEKLQTSLPSIFAAGDVRKKSVRQIATAVGDGALAAMTAHEFLVHSS